jgi:hypothetical protein
MALKFQADADRELKEVRKLMEELDSEIFNLTEQVDISNYVFSIKIN